MDMSEHAEAPTTGRPPESAPTGGADQGPPDILEHRAPVRGESQTLDTRLFVQLQVFTECLDPGAAVEAVKRSGLLAAVYANRNDARGIGIVAMDEDPAMPFFVGKTLYQGQQYS